MDTIEPVHGTLNKLRSTLLTERRCGPSVLHVTQMDSFNLIVILGGEEGTENVSQGERKGAEGHKDGARSCRGGFEKKHQDLRVEEIGTKYINSLLQGFLLHFHPIKDMMGLSGFLPAARYEHAGLWMILGFFLLLARFVKFSTIEAREA